MSLVQGVAAAEVRADANQPSNFVPSLSLSLSPSREEEGDLCLKTQIHLC